jgi:DNA primase
MAGPGPRRAHSEFSVPMLPNTLNAKHPYLRSRGIKEETAREFGVGFFSGKGSMSGRVVIPISNERGELVAYAGRSIDNTEQNINCRAASTNR